MSIFCEELVSFVVEKTKRLKSRKVISEFLFFMFGIIFEIGVFVISRRLGFIVMVIGLLLAISGMIFAIKAAKCSIEAGRQYSRGISKLSYGISQKIQDRTMCTQDEYVAIMDQLLSEVDEQIKLERTARKILFSILGVGMVSLLSVLSSKVSSYILDSLNTSTFLIWLSIFVMLNGVWVGLVIIIFPDFCSLFLFGHGKNMILKQGLLDAKYRHLGYKQKK